MSWIIFLIVILLLVFLMLDRKMLDRKFKAKYPEPKTEPKTKPTTKPKTKPKTEPETKSEEKHRRLSEEKHRRLKMAHDFDEFMWDFYSRMIAPENFDYGFAGTFMMAPKIPIEPRGIPSNTTPTLRNNIGYLWYNHMPLSESFTACIRELARDQIRNKTTFKYDRIEPNTDPKLYNSIRMFGLGALFALGKKRQKKIALKELGLTEFPSSSYMVAQGYDWAIDIRRKILDGDLEYHENYSTPLSIANFPNVMMENGVPRYLTKRKKEEDRF